MSADLWKLLHWERESVKPPEHYTAEQQYGWRQAMAQGRTILSDYQQHGIGKEAFALLPAASPEGRGASCSDYAPAGYTGHWREWHRGHGCNLDDTAAKAEGRGAPTEVEALAAKAHQWLETVEQNRTIVCECGRTHRTYIGLDHHMGENMEGCDFCVVEAKHE